MIKKPHVSPLLRFEKIAFKIVIMSYRVGFRTISKQYMFVLESMQG